MAASEPRTADRISMIHDRNRLAAVRRSRLVDTPPEECFDRLIRLAAESTASPAAFLSIVDERGDFFKSTFGFPGPFASLRWVTGETFCHHAIIAGEMLVVDDARKEPPYAELDSVRKLGVVAYVGIVLRSPDGQPLGAFCVVDMKPRTWSHHDVDTILLLARAALREIETRCHASIAVPRDEIAKNLSVREREVMLRLVAGQRLKEIALGLGVSVKTVATHRARMLDKLGLSDNRDLLRYALERGLLDWRKTAAPVALRDSE